METKNLKEESSTFNLKITKELEKNIRNMCALSPANEWSGVLFYTYTGKIEDNTLELEAKDFFLMDLGEHAHTVFDFDAPEITQYMFLNKLMDCSMGLIHSHCNFSAFFSGEDEGTLQAQGEIMNNFLSLVVNDDGNYVARLTRQNNENGVIKVVYDGVVTSPLFKDGDYVVSNKHEESSKEYSKQEISYFNLNIIKESAYSDALNDRFGQLYKAPEPIFGKKGTTGSLWLNTPEDDIPPFENNFYGGYGFYGSSTKPTKEKTDKTKKSENKKNTTDNSDAKLSWIKLILVGGPVGKVLAGEHPIYTDIYDKAFKTRDEFLGWAQNSIVFNSEHLTSAEFESYGSEFATYLNSFSDIVLSRKYKNFWLAAADELF